MFRLATIIATIVTGALAAGARADNIWLGKLLYSDSRITDVKECRIQFSLATGRRIIGKMKDVSRLEITNEAEFNEAEKQMTQLKKYDEAARIYAGLLAKGRFPANKPWMERLVAHRLLRASDLAARVDTAVRAWLIIMDANDASEDAIALIPKVPAKNNGAVAAAITLLATREKHAKLAYRNAANPYRMKLLQLAGRNEEAANLAMIISQGAAANPTGNGTTSRAAFVAKIDAAEQFLKVNKPSQAVTVLEPMMNAFTDVELPRALLALGRAQFGVAKAASGQQKKTLLCKSALSFMRVLVATGAGPQDKANALVYTGQVNESFDKPNTQAAKKCYSKVLADEALKGTPAATQAQALLGRLK